MVADRSFVNRKISLFPWVPPWLHCLSHVKSQSHRLRVDKLQNHIRRAKALKDARMKAVVNKLLRIHAAFIS